MKHLKIAFKVYRKIYVELHSIKSFNTILSFYLPLSIYLNQEWASAWTVRNLLVGLATNNLPR